APLAAAGRPRRRAPGRRPSCPRRGHRLVDRQPGRGAPAHPDVYRSGAGLPYPEYGADCRLAIANFNRPMFVNDLAGWFAAAPEVQARLAAEGARALDVGCGLGWARTSPAKAVPTLRGGGGDSQQGAGAP